MAGLCPVLTRKGSDSSSWSRVRRARRPSESGVPAIAGAAMAVGLGGERLGTSAAACRSRIESAFCSQTPSRWQHAAVSRPAARSGEEHVGSFVSPSTHCPSPAGLSPAARATMRSVKSTSMVAPSASGARAGVDQSARRRGGASEASLGGAIQRTIDCTHNGLHHGTTDAVPRASASHRSAPACCHRAGRRRANTPR